MFNGLLDCEAFKNNGIVFSIVNNIRISTKIINVGYLCQIQVKTFLNWRPSLKMVAILDFQVANIFFLII